MQHLITISHNCDNPTKKRFTLLYEVCFVTMAFVALTLPLGLFRINEFIIFCIFALSFDFLYGYMGRLSFGQMLYLGTGAYLSTLFSIHIHSNPFLSIAAGVIGGTVMAGLVGAMVAKLSGASFALANLAFNQIGFFLINSAFQNVTHGEDGIEAKILPFAGIDLTNEWTAFVFMLCSLLLVFILFKRLTSSPYGIMIRSIKENENRVSFLGYNILWYKWLTLVISGAIAAFAGSLYTVYNGFISPDLIHPLHNIEVIFACLIGGAGNLYGAMIGGIVFMTMKDVLANYLTNWEWLLGVVLLMVVFFMRQGVTGAVQMILNSKFRKNKTEKEG